MKSWVLFLSSLLVLVSGCGKNPYDPSVNEPEQGVMSISDVVLNESFIGNGPQWGGYDMVPAWTGEQTLSAEDWETIFARVSFMRPGMVRIMVSPGWNYMDGSGFNPSKSDAVLGKILDYCQKAGICVNFGEWGHVGGLEADDTWVENAVGFLSYLVKEKGYTCIKHYTIVNEPNGNWSTINGNYSLWSKVIRKVYAELERKGLDKSVDIMGPDVAVWSISDIPWMSGTKMELHDCVRAYDIHLYPDDKSVYTTEFSYLLDSYRAASDKSRPLVVGELGFKYSSTSALGMANLERIRADKYAADDSQMHVYDSFYGIDMADATIQAMRAGYSGVIYWMLDDAMYNDTGNASSKRLKKWGFWNILGKEQFGNESDEDLRPWFYPVSLLCRFFPNGTKILDVSMPKPSFSGLRATAGIKDGKMSVAIVNNSLYECEFTLKSLLPDASDKMYEYLFISGDGAAFKGKSDGNGFPVPEREISFSNASADEGMRVRIPGESFVLYTNMK